jgi:D-glycero-D-manno-heptose 1,7-bisphosphate phosphatase
MKKTYPSTSSGSNKTTVGSDNRTSGSNKRKAIFLDRDGTIIEYVPILKDPSQVHLLDGAGEGLRALSELGFLLVVVTNQSEIEKGSFTIEQTQAVHDEIQRRLLPFGVQIDGFYVCPHCYTEPAHCTCRKPDIGMLKQAEGELGIDMARSIIIGDSTRDVQTGINAGVPTILVLTGMAGGGDDKKFFDVKADHTAADLSEAAKVVAENFH